MESKNNNLSYVIATRNRLPFLKITLETLINNLHLDEEEIIIIDGNSTDGTKEYLQGLFEQGKIHQFISEPDRNQAQAWNKAMLMAKGTIIKKIIDDDVHDYNAIRRCKQFMLEHSDIDVCVSECLQSSLSDPDKVGIASRLHYYHQWKNGLAKAFTFSDVSMLIRKSSLSFIGLYDTQFKMIDWEYALRISFLQSKIAYYTGYNSLSVDTPGNVSSTATKKLFQYEEKIGTIKYGYNGDRAEVSMYSHLKIWIGKTLNKLLNSQNTLHTFNIPPESELKKIYTLYYQKLDEHNKTEPFDFIA